MNFIYPDGMQGQGQRLVSWVFGAFFMSLRLFIMYALKLGAVWQDAIGIVTLSLTLRGIYNVYAIETVICAIQMLRLSYKC